MKKHIFSILSATAFSVSVGAQNLGNAPGANLSIQDPLGAHLGLHQAAIENSQCYGRCGLERSDCNYSAIRKPLNRDTLKRIDAGLKTCILQFEQCMSQCDEKHPVSPSHFF